MKRSVIVVLAIVAGILGAAAVRLHAQDSQPHEVSISAKRFEFTPSQVTLKRGANYLRLPSGALKDGVINATLRGERLGSGSRSRFLSEGSEARSRSLSRS